MMTTKLREVLEKASAWPEEAQEQLAEVAREIESGLGATYQATPEELEAIDDADRSGVASDDEVRAAFRAFRRA